MEIAIGIAIGAVIGLLFKRRNSHTAHQTHVDIERQRKLRVADEVVTVILPTINRDK